MSKNNDTKSLLETALTALVFTASVILQAKMMSDTDTSTNRSNENHNTVYHMYMTPIVGPESAKDFAIVSAKLREAEREPDSFGKYNLAKNAADFAEDKDDYIKVYTIGELEKIANGCKNRYWRRRILEQIDEL